MLNNVPAELLNEDNLIDFQNYRKKEAVDNVLVEIQYPEISKVTIFLLFLCSVLFSIALFEYLKELPKDYFNIIGYELIF